MKQAFLRYVTRFKMRIVLCLLSKFWKVSFRFSGQSRRRSHGTHPSSRCTKREPDVHLCKGMGRMYIGQKSSSRLLADPAPA